MSTASKVGLLGTLLLCAVAGCAAGEVDDGDTSGNALSAPGAGSGLLLALGDSIAYGWQPEWEQGEPKQVENLQDAVLGRGYPEKAGKLLGLRVDNASCPGEASGSFVDATQEDNGCREKRTDGLKMQTGWGEASTQLEFAQAYIQEKHPEVITLTVGGNDLFLLRGECKGSFFGQAACIATSATLGAPTTEYRKNLEAIFKGLYEAGHRGTVVMVNTYAMTYTTLSGEPLVFGAFNKAAAAAVANASKETPGMKIVVADAYARFSEASTKTSSNACLGKLLIDRKGGEPIADSDGKPTCDRHPSQSGHDLIAKEIARVAR